MTKVSIGTPERSCRGGAILKHLHLQGRAIGHHSVDFHKPGSLRVGNEKNRLYRFAPGVSKAAVKSDLKDILKRQVEILNLREVGKAIERLTRPAFVPQQIYKNFVYRSFVQNTARSPNKEMQIFMELHTLWNFHCPTVT